MVHEDEADVWRRRGMNTAEYECYSRMTKMELMELVVRLMAKLRGDEE